MNAAVDSIRHGVLPSDYKTVVDHALVETLKDPDSRKVQFGKTVAGVVCGQVNARNSFGGYTGFQMFVAGFGPDRQLVALRVLDGSSGANQGPEQAAIGTVMFDCALR